MSDTVKLPKHVAGVKIPKPLRQAAEAMLEQAATPAGRQLIAGALIAAAAALTRDQPAGGEQKTAEKPKSPIDMGALLGMAATSMIGGLRAASERKADAAPASGKPGEG
ncbi:hypothetical protein [Sphingomonas bacterium]|uniref:hypothetical protein n=1 Tax=Sphingomonas bacterium TaxID=1895847 RepID=UPI001575BF52|nr:hypothetical protein [Sphingomonas bacterium]